MSAKTCNPEVEGGNCFILVIWFFGLHILSSWVGKILSFLRKSLSFSNNSLEFFQPWFFLGLSFFSKCPKKAWYMKISNLEGRICKSILFCSLEVRVWFWSIEDMVVIHTDGCNQPLSHPLLFYWIWIIFYFGQHEAYLSRKKLPAIILRSTSIPHQICFIDEVAGDWKHLFKLCSFMAAF